MRADQFLALASPLYPCRDTEHDETVVVLAFVIEDGELGVMIVGPGGGRASIAPVEMIDFPAPVQVRSVPGMSGQAKLD